MNANPYTRPGLSRRAFINRSIASGATLAVLGFAAQTASLPAVLGPILGHMEPNGVRVWLRSGQLGEHVLEITPVAGGESRVFSARAEPENDLCIHWHAEGLSPATAYRYRIRLGTAVIAED